jgi:methylenetetrahydrofolate dehydrogenase (NADP+) / methenyltetrahydrofolate cyclohydrolase
VTNLGGAVLLDGRSLAQRREADIARRAGRVLSVRGRAPSLLLAVFADRDGRVQHLRGKLHACERTGIDAVPLVIPADSGTSAAVHALESASSRAVDAVFVQVPCPDSIDENALLRALPPALDVDIMTAERAEAYLRGEHDLSPVTVTGALALLDEYAIALEGRRGVLIADASMYAALIVEAFGRRGAPLDTVPPDTPDCGARAAAADIVVAAAGRPGIISAARLLPGCIALDFGYYNPGGRGDIDTGCGSAHLGALMPVPGGVGPMTVSALLERVVAFAESEPAPSR